MLEFECPNRSSKKNPPKKKRLRTCWYQPSSTMWIQDILLTQPNMVQNQLPCKPPPNHLQEKQYIFSTLYFISPKKNQGPWRAATISPRYLHTQPRHRERFPRWIDLVPIYWSALSRPKLPHCKPRRWSCRWCKCSGRGSCRWKSKGWRNLWIARRRLRAWLIQPDRGIRSGREVGCLAFVRFLSLRSSRRLVSCWHHCRNAAPKDVKRDAIVEQS